MANTEIHLISRRELATDPGWDRWHDPDAIAPISPIKQKALLENPLARGDDDPIQLVGTLDARVIGRLDLVGGALDVHGEEVPCTWGSALYVPKEFRKTLMGVKLILTMQRMHDTVGASGVSRLVYPLYRNLRWLDFELRRFVLLRRTRSLVERYVGRGVLGTGVETIADAALSAHGSLLSAWTRLRVREFETQEMAEFPEALASRLPLCDRRIVGHRSAAWINWLLRSSFDEPPSRRALFSVVGRDGHAAGYFLVRARRYDVLTDRNLRNLHLGSLQDWAAFDPTLRFEHITLLAARELFKWNVDAVEVCVPHDQSSAGLARLGFVRVGSMYTLVNVSQKSPLSHLAKSEAWRLRPAEGDNFFS
jgi:hypothetical protein